MPVKSRRDAAGPSATQRVAATGKTEEIELIGRINAAEPDPTLTPTDKEAHHGRHP